MAKKIADDDVEQETEFDIDTLAGDVRTSLLDKIRGNNMTWSMMTANQQETFAREIDQLARYVVRNSVDLVACQEMPSIDATCGEVKRRKDGNIEAKIGIRGTDELRHELFDATNSGVKIIVADAASYMGEREPVRIDPDQKRLLDD